MTSDPNTTTAEPDMSLSALGGLSVDEYIGRQVHHRLWELRESQTALARVLGIAQPNVSKRLRGETSWTAGEVFHTAAFLRVGVEDLMPLLRPMKALATDPEILIPGGTPQTGERALPFDLTAYRARRHPRLLEPAAVATPASVLLFRTPA